MADTDPDPCEFFESWASGSPDDRFAAVRDHSRNLIASMGGDPDRVEYRQEAPPNDPSRAAGYNREENVVYVNPGFTGGEFDGKTALDVTAEESRHAVQDQLEEDAGIPLDETSTDDDQALREDDARDFAHAYADDSVKACNLKKYGDEYGRRVIGADNSDDDEDDDDDENPDAPPKDPMDTSGFGDWILPAEDAADV